MERRRWLQIAVTGCVLVLCSGRELKITETPVYNSTLAKTLAEYTSAVYTNDLTQLFTWTCEKCGDLTEGFEMIELIIDVKNWLEAYVGFASDLDAVVVAFTGTQENSIQNWIEDLFWKQLDLDYPGMPEAKVQSGFYSAYHNTTLRDGVINGIQKTREIFQSWSRGILWEEPCLRFALLILLYGSITSDWEAWYTLSRKSVTTRATCSRFLML